MELFHLQTFLAVYRSGSFTGAATALNISQPAVTQHIKSLEAAIGRPLFQRQARGASPTSVADSLATEVAGSLDALQATASSFRVGAEVTAATVVIGGPADFLAAKVLPALLPLTANGLQIRTHIGLTKPLIADLANGELDVVIATAPTKAKGVSHLPLYSESLLLVCSPNIARLIDRSRLAGGDPGALNGVPAVAYDETMPLIRRFWRAAFHGQNPPTPNITIGDLRALMALVEQHAGVTVLPSYLAEASLRSGALIELRATEAPPMNQLTIATRTGSRIRHVSTVCQLLIDRCRHW
jgi:DNA-binding transcriptional LysR family regulator